MKTVSTIVSEISQKMTIQLGSDEDGRGFSRNTLIMLWSMVGVLVVSCVSIVVWYSNAMHKSKIAAANARVTRAISAANDWLNSNSPGRIDEIEKELVESLENGLATEVESCQQMLAKLMQRREQIQLQNRQEKARLESAAIWDEAKKKVESKNIVEAIVLLQKYLAKPYAIEKAAASQLLKEAETAVSDRLAIDTLVGLDAGDFEIAKLNGEIRNAMVSNPTLLEVQRETVQRNIEAAAQRRREKQLIEDQRVEKERLANERSEWLRTRTPDVRNACWGDSIGTVRQLEKEVSLEQEGKSLSGKVELAGHEAVVIYSFYEDRLVKVAYFIDFGKSGNPFEVDAGLRRALQENYGIGETEVSGLSESGWDPNAAFRTTIWTLPTHRIELKASSVDSVYRSLFLTYRASNKDAEAFENEAKRKFDKDVEQSREQLRKKL